MPGVVRRKIGGKDLIISRRVNDLARREGLQFNDDTTMSERPQRSISAARVRQAGSKSHPRQGNRAS